MLTRRAFQRSLTAALAAAPVALALPPRPKLMVLLVAGHFRTDYFDTHAASFSPGGFKRLLSGGAYFPNCVQQSVSFSATGLATIATGAYPATHGIVADRWYDPAAHSLSSAQADFLAATTFPASFLATDPRNRVFGIGQDSRLTRILTSVTPYTPDSTKNLAPDTTAKQTWMATASPTGAAAPAPLRTLDPAKAKDFNALWRSSPMSQAAQFSFARDLITGNKLGRADGIDLLCINLDSLTALGLETGANSPLVFDMVNQLDRQVELLLKFLDDTLGENSYQVAFTAAHGIADTAQQRVAAQDVATELAKHCDLEAYIYPFVYLRSGNVESAVKVLPQAAAWYTASGACSHSGLIRQRLQNSFHLRRSGDAMIAYAPGVSEDFAGGRGVSYGSIYNYDTRVPLLFFGPQFRAAEIEDPVELTAVAPTLCRALGAELPSTSSGQILGAAFATTPR
jgi:predicted AlkP superfamily pyrophosphatase or phosphodiesterase